MSETEWTAPYDVIVRQSCDRSKRRSTEARLRVILPISRHLDERPGHFTKTVKCAGRRTVQQGVRAAVEQRGHRPCLEGHCLPGEPVDAR